MQLFSSLLFGVSASLDALLMGITYGIRRVHIGILPNLLTSFITLTGTCLSVGCGSLLGPLLPASLGTWIGSAVLILYGLYYLKKSMSRLRKKYLLSTKSENVPDFSCELTKTEHPETLSYRSALALGIALSANNMGIGLSASVAGLTLAPAAVMTILFSVAFLYLGNHLGRSCLSQRIGVAADGVSGMLLILLGLWELWF